MEYPVQQPKTDAVRSVLNALAQNKADCEKAAAQVAEDVLREAGYMLPQSDNAHELLKELIENPPTPDFPVEAAKKTFEHNFQ